VVTLIVISALNDLQDTILDAIDQSVLLIDTTGPASLEARALERLGLAQSSERVLLDRLDQIVLGRTLLSTRGIH